MLVRKVVKTKDGKVVGKESVMMNEENVCWTAWAFFYETHKTIIFYSRMAVSDQASSSIKV